MAEEKKKKNDKKTKAFYDWATTGIPVKKKGDKKKTKAFYDWATTGIPVINGDVICVQPSFTGSCEALIPNNDCRHFMHSRFFRQCFQV